MSIPDEIKNKIIGVAEEIYHDDNVRQMVHINGGVTGYYLSLQTIQEKDLKIKKYRQALEKIDAMIKRDDLQEQFGLDENDFISEALKQ